jgi:hypothetical protein
MFLIKKKQINETKYFNKLNYLVEIFFSESEIPSFSVQRLAELGSVVGKMLFLAHENDVASETLLAQRFNARSASTSASNHHSRLFVGALLGHHGAGAFVGLHVLTAGSDDQLAADVSHLVARDAVQTRKVLNVT